MSGIEMIVIDPTLRLIDYLIKLVDARKLDNRHDFETLIEPVFKDAETVAKDYFQVLSELIRRIEKAEDIPPVIRWLEERRVAYLPVRMKMRAYLRGFSQRSLDGLGNEVKPQVKGLQDKFTSGIQALLSGGLSLVEDGHIGVPGGISRHTLLDILIWDASKPFHSVKGSILERARRQEVAIHEAWADVVEGYTDLKAKAYGKKRRKNA
jgi:hypothetical protein